MLNLRTEEEIISSWKGDVDNPIVSFCCITYNHESFIKDTLSGFLIQETDFAFEILIHDDASTDRTADIIREYEAKYPRLIKTIYQTENKYSQGAMIIATYLFPIVKGKYIALCEGDDYWIDPKKIKKQYDFLQNNKEYSLSFHSASILIEEGQSDFSFYGEKIEDREYSCNEILEYWTIPTASVMFIWNEDVKKSIIPNISNKRFIYNDIVIFLTMSQHGKLSGSSFQGSVYRKHCGGLTSRRMDIVIAKKFINNYKEIQLVFSGVDTRIIKKMICRYQILISALLFRDLNVRFILPMISSLIVNPKEFFLIFKQILHKKFFYKKL